MFGSLQLAADVRSDRDEVAPRVMSYKAPIAGSDVAAAAPAPARRDAAAERLQPRLRRQPCRPAPIPSAPGAEAVGLRLHAQGHRAHADADPGEREGPAGDPPVRRHSSSRRACARPTHDAEHAALHQAGDAADVRQHQHRPPDDGHVDDRLHDRARASTTTSTARPPATRTWTSVSTSSG